MTMTTTSPLKCPSWCTADHTDGRLPSLHTGGDLIRVDRPAEGFSDPEWSRLRAEMQRWFDAQAEAIRAAQR